MDGDNKHSNLSQYFTTCYLIIYSTIIIPELKPVTILAPNNCANMKEKEEGKFLKIHISSTKMDE